MQTSEFYSSFAEGYPAVHRPDVGQTLSTCTGHVDTGVTALARFMPADVLEDCESAHVRLSQDPERSFKLDDLLESQLVQLDPLPEKSCLYTHGVELLDVTAKLADAGISEATFDPASPRHRQAVGHVLIAAAEAHFPDKRVIHMVNASRISGSAAYGECTVRRTTESPYCRAPLHAFHIDKFLPGFAKSCGHEGVQAGAKDLVDMYWPHWEADFTSRGLGKEDLVKSLAEGEPGLLNIWVSLTPGTIEQQPLVFIDKQSLMLQGRDSLNSVCSVPIGCATLKDKLNHLLRSRAARHAKFYWRPNMRFGEAFIFSSLDTPHSAVWLRDSARHSARCSAEMRLFIIDAPRTNARHNLG